MMLLCPKVGEIWPSIIKWWGVPKNRAMVRDIWFAIPATVAWLIWKGRNDLLFNQVQPECERLSRLACLPNTEDKFDILTLQHVQAQDS